MTSQATVCSPADGTLDRKVAARPTIGARQLNDGRRDPQSLPAA
jgi:hypothetical protein